MTKQKTKDIINYLLKFSPLITLSLFTLLYIILYQSFFFFIKYTYDNSYLVLLAQLLLISLVAKVELIHLFTRVFNYIYKSIFKTYQINKSYQRALLKFFQVIICEVLLILFLYFITKEDRSTYVAFRRIKLLYFNFDFISLGLNLALLARISIMSITFLIWD